MAVSAGITRGSQYIIKSKVQTGNKILLFKPVRSRLQIKFKPSCKTGAMRFFRASIKTPAEFVTTPLNLP
jgi:hypothetical protein